MAASIDELITVCRDVIGPLVRADKGELYLVAVEADRVVLHLAGRYAGCPGAKLVIEDIIGPAIAAVSPNAKVEVTDGISIPSGASLLV